MTVCSKPGAAEWGPLFEACRAAESAIEALRNALEEGTYQTRVRADFSSGVRSGVNGTPTFFINGKRHDGPFDYETLVPAIQEQIGRHGNAAVA